MKYKGNYFGDDKIIITDWNKRENDYNQVFEQLTIDTDQKTIKRYLKTLMKNNPKITFKVFIETWQGNSWSDYQEIKIDWNK
jgi:hypothetical protein